MGMELLGDEESSGCLLPVYCSPYVNNRKKSKILVD